MTGPLDVFDVRPRIEVRLRVACRFRRRVRARGCSARAETRGRATRTASYRRSPSAIRAASPWSRDRDGWSARRGRENSAGSSSIRASTEARLLAARQRPDLLVDRHRRKTETRRPGCAARRSIRAGKSLRSCSSIGQVGIEHVRATAARNTPSSGWPRGFTSPSSGATWPRNHLQQRRLAGAVLPHHAPALAAADRSGSGRRAPTRRP